MSDGNVLLEQYQFSEDDFLEMQEYMEHMKELPADENKVVENEAVFEEEIRMHLVERYMKRVPELALKKMNRGVSLKKLIEYGIVGVVLEVNKTANYGLSEDVILEGVENYMDRCFE